MKKNMVAYLLWPFSVLYYVISKCVFWFRQFDQKSSKRPVICIGNIFAGGVGKTPIVKEIANRLNSPVIMRGYKGGDEAKMLQKAGISVYTGDRKDNVALLNKKKTTLPIIMDDGFQNPGIKKDISILVFDGGLGLGNGFVLPAGPLREPLSAAARADAILIIGADKKNIKSRIQKIKPGMPVFSATTRSIDPGLHSQTGNIVAFAGIGYPKKFFDGLRELYGDKLVKTISFPDHYQYTEMDIVKLLDKSFWGSDALVTTEKDWVRLPAKNKSKIQFIPLETVIEPAFWTWLKEKTNANI